MMRNALGIMIHFLARIALIPVFASALIAQESVSLYLEPSTAGTVYFKEDLAELNDRDPEPFPADQEVTEWMVVDYPGTYVGYVKPSSVDENMIVAEGTNILLRPQDGSETLATVDGSFSPQVIELGPNWATVYYEGTAPAYFKWPSKRTAPVVETVTVSSASVPADGGEIVAVAETEEVVAPVAAIASPSPAPASTGNTTVAVAPVAAPAPKPVPAAPAPAAAQASGTPELAPMAAATRPSVTMAPPPPPLTSKQVTRVWEGKLVQNKGLEKLFNKDYPYYLENAAGERIAYVDLSEALLFKPVETYWNAQVIIDGTAEKIVDSTPVLIKVRVIRPKF